MAEVDHRPPPGLRSVLILAIGAVVVVLGAAVLTGLVPGVRDLVLGTPLLIAVLGSGTALVLWRILRAPHERLD